MQGWITGHTYTFPTSPSYSIHSYIVYRRVANGVIITVFESTSRPRATGRLSTSTSARSSTPHHIAHHDLSSPCVLGSIGEPIKPEAHWCNDDVGRMKCAIVDTFWQIETGSIVVMPFPGAVEAKPGAATAPSLGIVPAIVDPVSVQVRFLSCPHLSLRPLILDDVGA